MTARTRTRTTMMMMMTMTMMMMMVVCVSAASLGGSRRTDGKVEGFRENRENRGNVSTRLESHQDVNKTVEDSRSLKSHQDVNKTLDVSIRVTSHQDVNGTLENSTSCWFFRVASRQDVNETLEDSTRVASRQDVNETLEDSTRLDSHQDVNITLNNSTGDATLNPSRNETLMTPFMFDQQQQNRTQDLEGKGGPVATGAAGRRVAPPKPCQLSICAVMNLGHDLQSGGDELAGQSSSDPFGHGK